MGSLIHNWWRQLQSYPPGLRLRRFWQVRLWRDVRLQLHQQRNRRVLVACSQRVAADFAQVGCRQAKVISNGIPLPAMPEAAAIKQLRETLGLGNRLLVLMTAANFYLKGVMTALKAMSRLEATARNQFMLIVVGSDVDGTFHRFIRQHGLNDHCRLIGRVRDIENYYHAADIFLHPTYHDAGSLSTLKALAAGKAVVTSAYDGSSEMITNDVQRMILKKPGDVDELAGILRQLLDPALRMRLGLAAQALRPAIDQQRQFEALEQCYYDVLREKGSPP
jgi:glycosyltransferase involved in cell wall biosynthesis